MQCGAFVQYCESTWKKAPPCLDYANVVTPTPHIHLKNDLKKATVR